MESQKIARRILIAVLSVGMVLSAGLIPQEAAYAASKKPAASSVTLNHSVYTIKKGKSVKLKAKVFPSNAKSKKIVWSTSRKKTAEVSKKGKVKGKKAGKTVITAKVKGTKKKAKCTIYVGTPVTNAAFPASEISMKTGEQRSSGAYVLPANATVTDLKYESSNPAAATVDANGNITAVAEGTAVISATPVDEAGAASQMTVKVITSSVPASGLKILPETMNIEIGESFALKAEISPSQSTEKGVKFTSSDSSIATVDENGNVTGTGKGTVIITVTTADGRFSMECTVTVDKKKTIVSSQEELDKALANPETEAVEIKSDEELNIEISEGEYENIDLIINAPGAHVENSAKFEDVDIRAISDSTYVERASGNSIAYRSKSGAVKISDGAIAKVSVIKGSGALTLINDGTIEELLVEAAATEISIGGSSGQKIETTVAKTAEDASIKTSKELNVKASAKIALTILDGAEFTRVIVVTEILIPKVTGLGRIEVEVEETGETKNIVAENTGESIGTDKVVTLKGRVSDADRNPVEGANLYVIPYTGTLTVSEVAALRSSAAATGKTNSSGNYSISNVPAGNYYLLLQKSGYTDAVDTLIITGNNTDTFNVDEKILVLETAQAVKGRLGGYLKDAQTGEAAVSGLTVRLRDGSNNISGEVIAVTKTVSGGYYEFDEELPAGQYTVQVEDLRGDSSKRCVTTSFNAVVSGEGLNTADNTVTYVLESDQVRFVLTWGNEASGASADLDSHLIGPSASGSGKFHTWFSEKDYTYTGSSTEGAVKYADLDVDDTTWSGPETTTIYKRSSGTYSFYVHDYTNGDESYSDQMARSSAMVKVYIGSRLAATYYAPNEPGTLWYVCDYNSDTNKVTPNGSMSYLLEEDLDEFGFTEQELVQKYRERLQNRINEVRELLNQMNTGSLKTEGLSLVNNAERNLNSTEIGTMRDCAEDLEDWIDEIRYELHVWAEGAEIDDSWTVWNEGVLYIYGYTETAPLFTVKGYYYDTEDTVVYAVEASDKAGYIGKVTATTASGLKKTWYLKYEMDAYAAVYIDNVTSSDTNRLRIWDFWTGWDEDDYGEEYNLLNVYGDMNTDDINNVIPYLKIETRSSNASVEIKNSDKTGYKKMVVASCSGATRKYYLNYIYMTEEEWEEDW